MGGEQSDGTMPLDGPTYAKACRGQAIVGSPSVPWKRGGVKQGGVWHDHAHVGSWRCRQQCAGALSLTCRRGIMFRRLGSLAFQPSPHAMKLAMDGGVIEFMNAASGKQHDIHRRESMLAQADGLARQALETVAVDGSTHVLLAEDQPEARMSHGVGRGQGH